MEYLDVNLQGNNLGNNNENLKYLGGSLSKLSGLQFLILKLGCNNLRNIDSFKYLGEGLKPLHDLKEITLDLYRNNMG